MLHHYSEYGWLRGMNVVPSWGARIEQAWWDYHPQMFRDEIALATEIHANTIRLWIEFSAWMAEPLQTTQAFMDAITAIDELGMKTIPCLFNRWHDKQWDYGGTYLENMRSDWTAMKDYLQEIVEPLAGDPRILLWDLCNEPQLAQRKPGESLLELDWLTRVAQTVRDCGIEQPLTIGTHQSGDNMRIYAPLCDVLCCHPYGQTPEQMEEMMQFCAIVQKEFGKPMHCNECIPGSLSDTKRAACAQYSIPMLEQAGWGWMGWGLCHGKAVSTRKDRFDDNGLGGHGYHAWFDSQRQLRPGLEFLRARPKQLAPWQSQEIVQLQSV